MLFTAIGVALLHPASCKGHEFGKVASATGISDMQADRFFSEAMKGALNAADRTGLERFKNRVAANLSGYRQMADISRKEAPLMVRNITLKFGPTGHERVFIEFNRDATPAISSIGGKDPRIVVDIKNVLSIRQGLKRIDIRGKLVRQIRSNLDHASRQLRIVVDLVPSRNYDVEPVFYTAEKTYVIDISEDSAGRKK